MELSRNKIKPYDEVREHFIFRLNQRYDIDITNDEYDSITKDREKFIELYKINNYVELVYVPIKEKFVLCVYVRKKKRRKMVYDEQPPKLKTCLVLDEYLPCPNILRKINRFRFDREVFVKEIDNLIRQVMELSYEYYSVGKKNFFTNNKSDMQLKTATHRWCEYGIVDFNKLIQYLVKLELKNK
jgi:hypothetical protein